MSSKVKIKAAEFKGENRKQYVTHMFDSIAKNYDFLNNLLSFGVDVLWRKKVTKLIHFQEGHVHLDLATGTGELAFEIFKKNKCTIYGVDISKEMIKIAQEKNLNSKSSIQFSVGDAEKLNFSDQSVNSVTIAFGIRNFGDKQKALSEILRVLKPDGQLIILEFAKNRTPIIGPMFNFYFKHILPKIGSMFSSDKEAYKYLPDSVETFPSHEEFVSMINETGFINSYYKNYSFGISSMFYGEK